MPGDGALLVLTQVGTLLVCGVCIGGVRGAIVHPAKQGMQVDAIMWGDGAIWCVEGVGLNPNVPLREPPGAPGAKLCPHREVGVVLAENEALSLQA